MLWLLTQSPAFTYIYALTISIHCKFSSHSVVSRTHYHFFTDLSFSGAYHYMCCKNQQLCVHEARLSSCFCRISCYIYIFCMWNQIKTQIHQKFHFKDRLQCHLQQKYFFINSFTACSPNLLRLELQFTHSLQEKYSFCIRLAIYNTTLLHSTATACSSPAVREQEPSWQDSLSGACHLGALHWCQDVPQESSWLSDPWSDLKTSRKMAVFVLWQRSSRSQRMPLCRSSINIHHFRWY